MLCAIYYMLYHTGGLLCYFPHGLFMELFMEFYAGFSAVVYSDLTML